MAGSDFTARVLVYSNRISVLALKIPRFTISSDAIYVGRPIGDWSWNDCNRVSISRIVLLDFETNTSSEAEILCNQADCELSSITKMVMTEDKLYVVNHHKQVLIFEGRSMDFSTIYNE